MLTREDYKEENWDRTLTAILEATLKDGSIESPTPPPKFIDWLGKQNKYDYHGSLIIASSDRREAGTSRVSITEKK